MAIKILPLEERDIPALVRVELESFKPHPRIPILWPGGYTDELYAFYEAGKLKAYQEPTSRFIKAVDEQTGELVGCAQWDFMTEDPLDYGMQPLLDENEPPPHNWPEGGNWKLRRWFNINSAEIWNKYVAGRPFIVLAYLTILPEHQGKGIGSQLLKWGVAQADRLGCRMALESSPDGLRLYRNFGFRETEVIKCDMRAVADVMVEYDEEAAKRIFMVRELHGST